MKKYLAFVRIAWKDALFYRSKIMSSLFVWCLRAAVVCILYSYAYRYLGHAVNGISREVAIWSMSTYFVFLALSFRMVYSDLSKEVKHGEIEMRFNKPYSYPLFLILSRVAKSSPEFFLTAIAVLLFLLWYAPLHGFVVTPLWVFATLCLFVGGLILGCAFYFLIGLSAFWLEEADPVYWLFDKLVMIFGGSYVPVALFPERLRQIATYSPFGSMIFIGHIFYPDFLQVWPRLILIQWVWAMGLVLIAGMLFRYVRRHVFINGG